ncbi:hypothetical protein K438DRAFT_1800288 [Mycena galopus ATCC 62051]|nr:hypothetical protein K438DRAFT_1800288 [Mycena galopus ATCC 62051]
MPSIARTILLAVQVASFLALLGSRRRPPLPSRHPFQAHHPPFLQTRPVSPRARHQYYPTVEKLHAYSAKMKANYETMQSRRPNHPRSVSQAQWEAQCLLVVLGLNAVCGCPLSLDDGLACYDPSSGLELILKDTINTSKNILSVTAALTQNIPLLGPLVDDIKCILDEVLDAVENLTDCLLDITSKAVIALGLGDLVKGLLPGLLPGLR